MVLIGLDPVISHRKFHRWTRAAVGQVRHRALRLPEWRRSARLQPPLLLLRPQKRPRAMAKRRAGDRRRLHSSQSKLQRQVLRPLTARLPSCSAREPRLPACRQTRCVHGRSEEMAVQRDRRRGGRHAEAGHRRSRSVHARDAAAALQAASISRMFIWARSNVAVGGGIRM